MVIWPNNMMIFDQETFLAKKNMVLISAALGDDFTHQTFGGIAKKTGLYCLYREILTRNYGQP